ncbi:hypothetical protein A2875_05015 [Candidatus Gottesmanbacteria bacterium RIFCSPHIGHO2_01_FULL_46_14]|uniref:Uncharacterized protein n=3 Tax=Microgenomates group TaxID=1794810 RepID=A0A1F5ZQF6_9BACT|nr:MAG: hypothetical protein UU34_C0006G0019 [Candidatus Curtissbacteria bacterium GW2011_GWA1_41_11]OGG14689.1 MAG: hypothetical protein A2875_05015 [Candidatus Gottesmanbacteria bacterium RIFCSPHIGHO2_01_FULL_46_14]OGG29946.1 MAG: hypothetical protein A2971_04305 [Candidatus Gottesmanbacteria bacterium RIFCSPLOWO2_01_FULL_46_21]
MKLQMVHYVVLVSILAGGIASFVILRGDVAAQQRIGIVTAVAYVIWGIVHHAASGDLHRKVVIEYVLVGAVAILVLVNVLRP